MVSVCSAGEETTKFVASVHAVLSKINWRAEPSKSVIEKVFFLDKRKHKTNWVYNATEFNNDYFVGNDDTYTQGFFWERSFIGFPYVFDNGNQKFLSQDDLKKTSDQAIIYKDAYAIALLQTMYTPSKLSSPFVQIGDHPYASYMGASFGMERRRKQGKSNKLTKREFFLGVLGEHALGGPTQAQWHKWIDDEKPLGWHHQIKGALPGGVVFNYAYQHSPYIERGEISSKFRFFKDHFFLTKRFLKDGDWEFRPIYSFNLGQIKNSVGMGVEMRFGVFDDFINDYDVSDPNPGMLKSMGASKKTTATVKKQAPDKKSRFLFLGFHPEYVFHDATLQGDLFGRDKSPYTVNNLVRTRVKYYFGFSYELKKDLFLTFSKHFENERLTNEPKSWARNAFGRIELAASWKF